MTAHTIALPETSQHTDAYGLNAAERHAMTALRGLLRAASYSTLYLEIAGGAPFAASRDVALARVAELPSEEARLLRLLALGLPVDADALTAKETALLELLHAVALADTSTTSRGSTCWATSGWIVVPALGGYLITGIPPTYARAADIGAPAYLGFESFPFAALLPDPRGRRVLDIGAGCGIQGLLACRGATEVVLTDLDPFALRACALNAALNATEHPIRICSGDLYEPVRGERFDLVVALPPYVPEIPDCGIAITTGGGPDGLGMIRPLLAGAADALSARGELLTFGQLLCDDGGPLLRHELETLAPGLSTRLVAYDRHPLQPYVVELARRLVAHGSPLPLGELIARYSTALRALGATGVCTAVIGARPSSAPRTPRLVGPPSALVASSVTRQAGAIEPSAIGLEAVTCDGRAPVHLDPVSAALLRAIDGQRTIAECAAIAWGRPPGADLSDLVEAAIGRVGELVRLGLVSSRTSDDR